MIDILFIVYWLAVAGLCAFGINCYVLCFLFARRRRASLLRLAAIREQHGRHTRDDKLPFVTVQLPVFNERFVVSRLIDAVAALDYPASRLQIQVLDDSTDDTVEIVAERVRHHRSAGLLVDHVRRSNRDGFKAGALRDGMKVARGDLLAIFDADFVPNPDYLHQVVPLFRDERVGLVQARWGHLNRGTSAMTRAQAVAIDGHFSVEQAARCWNGLLLNFNGTAGIWRREAIEDAGGWQADTLTEDLDLSYRAQLAGWNVEYALDVEVPAEIPADIAAFKSQQRRWAKGSIQTAIKLLPRVLRSSLRPFAKLQAVAHLTHYLIHPLMLIVAGLAVPVLMFWEGNVGPATFAVAALLLIVGTFGPTTLYVTAQRALHADWRQRIRSLPMLMMLGTGIAVSNTRAVLEALVGHRSPFVRTPKRNLTDDGDGTAPQAYRLPSDPLFLVEAAFSLYAAWGVLLYTQHGKYLIGPFLVLYAAGFGYVAVRSVKESLGRPRRARRKVVGPNAQLEKSLT